MSLLPSPTPLITPPDLEMTFSTITEAQAMCRFNFAAPGWYYRDEGRSCLLLTITPVGDYLVRIWNAMDPRPELRVLLEMQKHDVA